MITARSESSKVIDDWEVQVEGGTLPDATGYSDEAAALLDNSVCVGKPETGPLPDLLGREERFEDRIEIFRRDAGTGILDRDRHEITAARGLGAQGRDVLDLPHADRQLAFAVHGIAAIDRFAHHAKLRVLFQDVAWENWSAGGGRVLHA